MKNNTFIVEKFNDPADLPSVWLHSFDNKCFEKDGMSQDEWEDALAKNSYVCVAIGQSGIIGIAVAKHGGGMGYLYSSAVLLEVRGLGIGKALVRHRVSILKELGCGKIQAHTRIDNEASQAMLRSCGFQAIQYVTDFYDDFEDAVLWELDL